jgi:hypothetical protein
MICISPETEELARRIAERSGKSPELVVEEAVAAGAREVGIVAVDGENLRHPVDIDRVMEIVRRVSERPLRDRRPARDILDELWRQAG